MKSKLLLTAMCAWLALPHSQSAAEMRVIQAGCKRCGGDLAYVEGDTESTCQSCTEKYALVILFLGGCIAVGAAGCWTVKKLKKMGEPGGRFSATNRFGTNLFSALNSTNAMSVVQMEAQDVPYLLSLATAHSATGRYHLESSSDMVNWTEIGRYRDDQFLAVSEANGQAGYFRVRVE